MSERQRYLPISRDSGATAAGGKTPARRAGWTLVEMMVAVVIMSVGLLGLVGTSAVVTRQVSGAATRSTAANVIQSRLEWMRSVPCSAIKDSTVTTRGVTEHWVPIDTVNRIVWVTDTVKFSVDGSVRTQVYTMTAQCP
jgi:prepilin-type N-terminal cleavage/methylation domain-containing protein